MNIPVLYTAYKASPLRPQCRIGDKLLWADSPHQGRGVTYTLRATIEHVGDSTESGHYIANVKQPDDTWVQLNDEIITAISQKEVVNGSPYILLYEMCGSCTA